jgi:hypothetical protein
MPLFMFVQAEKQQKCIGREPSATSSTSSSHDKMSLHVSPPCRKVLVYAKCFASNRWRSIACSVLCVT